jgi:hypothetical protein
MIKQRTIRYLDGTSAKRGYDGQVPLPVRLCSDPTFVSRLSYKFSDIGIPGRLNLHKTITQAPPEVAFFLDTNMWDRTLEPELWAALLARRDSIFVIPNVRLELKKWIVANPNFPGSQAIMDKKSNLIIMDLPPNDSDELTAYAYYAFLLQIRRRAGDFVTWEFRKREGRDPTPDELVSGIQRSVGERGLALIHKHGKTATLDRWATDESLVYFAAKHAVSTGRPTTILTMDQDVLEQFYKLWWFLDTHYRAMLMADEYVRDPLRYRLLPLPDLPRVRDVFNLDDGMLLERGATRMNAVLPRGFKFVSSECWLVGQKLVRLTFGAECQMHQLLKMKGATGGLVSDQLRGRNLHPWLVPLPLGRRIKDCAAIVRDRTVPIPGSRAAVGLFDVCHSVNTVERFSHLVPDTSWSRSRIIPPWP